MADPGVPSDIAEAVADDLADDLRRDLGGQWTVCWSQESLPVDPDGEIPLTDRAPNLLRRHDWDFLVYLSDLTQHRDGTSVRYEVGVAPAVIVSVPAEGMWRQRSRIRRLVLALIEGGADGENRPFLRAAGPGATGRADDRVWPPKGEDLPQSDIRGWWGHLRLLSGMVRSNRPSGMLRALHGCTAVAMASGTFGIFFGSVWQIAATLSNVRLIGISLMAIGALTAWLIMRNGLWARTRTNVGSLLDNAATVITVGSATLLMHLILVGGLCLLAFVVVESSYFAQQLGHPVGFSQYLILGWFAAGLGTMAGAVGSNFDSEESVREATYSQRWHERRKMFDTYDARDDARSD